MWIFTNKGLLSVVQDRDSDRLLVRARQRHLLQEIAPRPSEVFEDQTADYPFRVFMTRMEFAEIVYEEIERIDYDNFKNSVKDRVLAGLYSKVWSIMSVLGMGRRYGTPTPSAEEIERLPPSAFEDDGTLKDDWHRHRRRTK